jgi:hypothetical protein
MANATCPASRRSDRSRWAAGGTHAVHLQHGQIVVRCHPDQMCGHELARCHPNPNLTGAVDHVIIRGHVSCRIPHNARSGLNDAFLLFLQWELCWPPLSEHMHHRWRHGLEELYRRLFGLSEVAARRDGTWPVGGSATNLVPLPDFTRISTVCLPASCRSARSFVTPDGLETTLPATSRMTSPLCMPRSAAGPLGSTAVTATP